MRTIIRSHTQETDHCIAEDIKPKDIARIAYRTIPDELRIIDFMSIFYKYRDVLGYNSFLFIPYVRIMKQGHGLCIYCDTHQSPRPCIRYYLTGTEIPSFLPQIPEDLVIGSLEDDHFYYPVAALLTTKDNKIIPLDNSVIERIYKINKSLIRSLSIETSFTLHCVDVGAFVFMCDYLYSPKTNSIKIEFQNRDVEIPTSMVDFISINKPSLCDFVSDSLNYRVFIFPKITSFIAENYKDIITDIYDSEAIEQFIKANSFDASSISFEYVHKNEVKLNDDRNIKPNTELKRTQNNLK